MPVGHTRDAASSLRSSPSASATSDRRGARINSRLPPTVLDIRFKSVYITPPDRNGRGVQIVVILYNMSDTDIHPSQTDTCNLFDIQICYNNQVLLYQHEYTLYCYLIILIL